MALQLQPTSVQTQLLIRLDSFVQIHGVTLSTFWQTNRLCIQIEEFLSFLQKIRFKVRPEELAALEANQLINLEAVLKVVETWRKQQGNACNFITKQVEKNSQADLQQNKDKHEINPSTGNLKSKTTSRIRGIERQLQQEIKLNQTLIHAKNESDYELTIKVGEANDISKKNKGNYTYLINSGNGEPQIIQVDSKTGQQTVISRKVFEKKYEQIKIASLSRVQQIEGTLQEDLKKTLVQVMYLSSQLQEQIALLQSKGITH